MDVTEAVEVACIRGARDAEAAGLTPKRRALEIAAHVSLVACVRPYSVDGAELVGFIRNTDPDGTAEPNDLAAAIVERFKLEECADHADT